MNIDRPRIVLALLAGLSLFQFTLLSRLAHPFLLTMQTVWATMLVNLRVPALIVCFVVCIAVSGWQVFKPALPRSSLKLVLLLSAITCIAAYLLANAFRSVLPEIQTTPALIIFLFTGLLAEEMWFRGAVFDASKRVFQGRSEWWPIIISAVLFSLCHWQYHAFRLSAPALAQMAYTLPLGLVLGWIRASTGNLCPVIGLHMVVNLIAATQM